MENKIVNLQVNDNINETNKSLGTLKSQLREAQNEVNSLSEKFGATSREAVEAAKQAAVLKDKIGDAKALTDAFNPDAKFKAVSASLSGVASGFAAYQGAMGLAGVESKDLEQQLL
jgi:seryl-tRNA synthetase